MRVSRYLLRYWARHLGAEGLCLVIAARQMAYEQRLDTPRREEAACSPSEMRFRATRDRLAARAAISERTVGRRLQRQAVVGLFLQQKEKAPPHRAGEYVVRAHDPLAPEHVHGLAAYLREALSARVGPLPSQRRRAVQLALRALLAMSPAGARQVLERADPHPNPLPHRERADPYSHSLSLIGAQGVRVREIVSALGVEAEWTLCEEVERHLVEPERVLLISHSFWKEWLPRLGPRRGGLLLNLRSRCFYNERSGELRDTCRESYRQLARELGLSHRQVERLLAEVGRSDSRIASTDPSVPPLRRFIQIVEPGLGRRLALFRVLMRDPHPDVAETSPPGDEGEERAANLASRDPLFVPANDDIEAGQLRHPGTLVKGEWRHPGGTLIKHYDIEKDFKAPARGAPSFFLAEKADEKADWRAIAGVIWPAILLALDRPWPVGKPDSRILEEFGNAGLLAMRGKTRAQEWRRPEMVACVLARGP